MTYCDREPHSSVLEPHPSTHYTPKETSVGQGVQTLYFTLLHSKKTAVCHQPSGPEGQGVPGQRAWLDQPRQCRLSALRGQGCSLSTQKGPSWSHQGPGIWTEEPGWCERGGRGGGRTDSLSPGRSQAENKRTGENIHLLLLL